MNKPVAWNEEEFNAIAYSYRSWPMHDPKGVSERYDELVNYVQSITHPVKELMMVLDGNRVYPAFKELTDEEILKIADDPDLCNYDGSLRSCIDFAKAILRKAQEK